MELFNPELPGAVAVGSAFRRSGWREWDELSKDEQKAHTAAVKAKEDAATKTNADRVEAFAAAQEAAAEAVKANAELDSASQDVNAAVSETPPETPDTPETGDTTKE